MGFFSGCMCWANARWARAHPMRVSCMQANVAASESPSVPEAKNMHKFASIPSHTVPDHPASCYGARDPFRSQQTLSVVCLTIHHDVCAQRLPDLCTTPTAPGNAKAVPGPGISPRGGAMPLLVLVGMVPTRCWCVCGATTSGGHGLSCHAAHRHFWAPVLGTTYFRVASA